MNFLKTSHTAKYKPVFTLLAIWLNNQQTFQIGKKNIFRVESVFSHTVATLIKYGGWFTVKWSISQCAYGKVND